MAANTEFTPQKTADLIQAQDLSISRLSTEKQAILERVEAEKESLRVKLGRLLTDEEEEGIESSIPGAGDIIGEVSNTMSASLREVRAKGEKKM
jgi:hypothetical protein